MTSTADLPKTFGGYRLTILRNDDLLYPSAFQWHVILRSSTAHSIILSRDNALIYQRKFFRVRSKPATRSVRKFSS
jgi:hypothetical protein